MTENGICKVAAVVVLYYPDDSVLSNISSYYQNISKLIVIDNSEIESQLFKINLYDWFPDAIYVFLNRNSGIAFALNIGCEIALKNDCRWLFTMDQDSAFQGNHCSKFLKSINVLSVFYPRIGIISPCHILYPSQRKKSSVQYAIKKVAMTSGNLLNLHAYTDAGPFQENLFMDVVDYEYCLRLGKRNYLILQDGHVFLNHSLGKYKIKKLFSWNIGVTNHNAVRRYYITRNSLYVGFKYFNYDIKFLAHVVWNIFFKDPFLIICFEQNKISKVKAVIKGIFHFMISKYGKVF